MHLPRVRFTVGILLCAVTIVAANCVVLTLLSETAENIFEDPSAHSLRPVPCE
jgi:hypothetical protein